MSYFFTVHVFNTYLLVDEGLILDTRLFSKVVIIIITIIVVAAKKSSEHRKKSQTTGAPENRNLINSVVNRKFEIENLLAKHQQLNYLEKYHNELHEIIVLFREECQGASYLTNDLMLPSAFYLAYQSVNSGEIHRGEGRVNWVTETKDIHEFGLMYPYNFKGGGMYKLLVRKRIRKDDNNKSISFNNNFFLLNVIEEVTINDALSAIWLEYQKPVAISDEVLGNFTLLKKFSWFEGSIKWLRKSIKVYLEVDIENENSWKEALSYLRILYDNQADYDVKFRYFAARQLIELANDWAQDDNEITEGDFAKRISLEFISIDARGNYNAGYDDNDIFAQHGIDVKGNVNTGIESADMG